MTQERSHNEDQLIVVSDVCQGLTAASHFQTLDFCRALFEISYCYGGLDGYNTSGEAEDDSEFLQPKSGFEKLSRAQINYRMHNSLPLYYTGVRPPSSSSIRRPFSSVCTVRALAFEVGQLRAGWPRLPHSKQRPCRKYSRFSFSEVAFRITKRARVEYVES